MFAQCGHGRYLAWNSRQIERDSHWADLADLALHISPTWLKYVTMLKLSISFDWIQRTTETAHKIQVFRIGHGSRQYFYTMIVTATRLKFLYLDYTLLKGQGHHEQARFKGPVASGRSCITIQMSSDWICTVLRLSCIQIISVDGRKWARAQVSFLIMKFVFYFHNSWTLTQISNFLSHRWSIHVNSPRSRGFESPQMRNTKYFFYFLLIILCLYLVKILQMNT
jgi:hypothetical protein